MPDNFGRLLESLVRARYKTASRFCEAVGVGEPFVSRIINGEKAPPLDRVDQWARALDLREKPLEDFVLAAHLANMDERSAELVRLLLAHDEQKDRMISDLERQVELLKDIIARRADPSPPQRS